MRSAMAAACVLAALVCTSLGGEQTTLAIRWEPGKTYTFEVRAKTVGTTKWLDTPGAPKPVEMLSDITQKIRLKALARRPDGGIDLMWLTLAAKSLERMGSKEMAFETGESSANDKNPPIQIWNQSVTTPFKVILKPDGKLDKVEKMDEFRAKMISQFGPQAGPFVDASFGEESKRMIFDHILPVALPSQPVAEAASWDWKGTRTVQGATVEDSLTVTFAKWVDVGGAHCAQIEFTGKVEADMDGVEEMPGMETTMKPGKVTGHSAFDPALGMPREIENEQVFVIDRRYPSPAGVQHSSQDNDITLTVKLLSVE